MPAWSNKESVEMSGSAWAPNNKSFEECMDLILSKVKGNLGL